MAQILFTRWIPTCISLPSTHSEVEITYVQLIFKSVIISNIQILPIYHLTKSTCILPVFHYISRVTVMVLNTTFNKISVILWRPVLLVEATRVPGENHWPVTCHWQTLSHNVVWSTPHLSGIQTHNSSGDRHWLYM